MQNQKIIFSQIASLIPWYQFDKMVNELNEDYQSKSIYALDSRVINIFFFFPLWQNYMENKEVGAIKLHSLIDLKEDIPSFNVITERPLQFTTNFPTFL